MHICLVYHFIPNIIQRGSKLPHTIKATRLQLEVKVEMLQWIIRCYYEQLYENKWDNPEQMCNFLETQPTKTESRRNRKPESQI